MLEDLGRLAAGDNGLERGAVDAHHAGRARGSEADEHAADRGERAERAVVELGARADEDIEQAPGGPARADRGFERRAVAEQECGGLHGSAPLVGLAEDEHHRALRPPRGDDRGAALEGGRDRHGAVVGVEVGEDPAEAPCEHGQPTDDAVPGRSLAVRLDQRPVVVAGGDEPLGVARHASAGELEGLPAGEGVEHKLRDARERLGGGADDLFGGRGLGLGLAPHRGLAEPEVGDEPRVARVDLDELAGDRQEVGGARPALDLALDGLPQGVGVDDRDAEAGLTEVAEQLTQVEPGQVVVAAGPGVLALDQEDGPPLAGAGDLEVLDLAGQGGDVARAGFEEGAAVGPGLDGGLRDQPGREAAGVIP